MNRNGLRMHQRHGLHWSSDLGVHGHGLGVHCRRGCGIHWARSWVQWDGAAVQRMRRRHRRGAGLSGESDFWGSRGVRGKAHNCRTHHCVDGHGSHDVRGDGDGQRGQSCDDRNGGGEGNPAFSSCSCQTRASTGDRVTINRPMTRHTKPHRTISTRPSTAVHHANRR